MQRKFAKDVSCAVHELGQLETIAVKTASENASAEAQRTISMAASGIYDVIQQKAAEECAGDFCQCVDKVATTLQKPKMSVDAKTKLAAAVAVDTVLTEQPQTEKIARARAYGREFIAEFLREII